MTVSASQFNVAYEALADRTAWLKAQLYDALTTWVVYTLNNTSTGPSVAYAITQESTGLGAAYALSGGNAVQVPVAGLYRVSWGVTLSGTAPTDWGSTLKIGAVSTPSSSPPFNSSAASPRGGHDGSRIVSITTPSTQKITLVNDSASNTTPSPAGGVSRITIERLIGT